MVERAGGTAAAAPAAAARDTGSGNEAGASYPPSPDGPAPQQAAHQQPPFAAAAHPPQQQLQPQPQQPALQQSQPAPQPAPQQQQPALQQSQPAPQPAPQPAAQQQQPALQQPPQQPAAQLQQAQKKERKHKERRRAVGTPDYLAPELLLGVGHGPEAVRIWFHVLYDVFWRLPSRATIAVGCQGPQQDRATSGCSQACSGAADDGQSVIKPHCTAGCGLFVGFSACLAGAPALAVPGTLG